MAIEHFFKYFIVFIVVPFFQTSLQSENVVTKETEIGKLQGIRKKVLNRDVDIFLGIPYAQPPIGNLRFQPPQPLKSSPATTISAKKLPSSCWQQAFPGVEVLHANTPLSEDCLYLNIWQLASNLNQTDIKGKAVMIWIYGGGFVTGTSTLSLYDGAALASEGGVIVVSFNYRLGPFGFLYIGNKMAPGNMGLLDQNLAFQWVHDNIQAFGGDKDRVTIFGESAGAASASFHIFSSKSNTLFRSAILQSGSPTREWAYVPPSEARAKTYDLAGVVGCPIKNDVEVLECLKRTNASLLSIGQYKINPGKLFISSSIPFCPTIDGEFIKHSPARYVEEGNYEQQGVMLGYNQDEGSLFIAVRLMINRILDKLSSTPSIDQKTFTRLVKEILPQNASDKIDNVLQAYGIPNTSEGYLQAMSQIIGDITLKCPIESLAHGLSKKIPVYLYQYDHRTSADFGWAKWMGVMHGFEIDHVFGAPLVKPGYTDEEKKFSKIIIQYWTNFAKTGNPNKGEAGSSSASSSSTAGSSPLSNWPTFTETEKNLMHLNLTQQKADKNSMRDKYCKVLQENRLQLELDDSSANHQLVSTSLLVISAIILVFYRRGCFTENNNIG